ncbi:response regulator transcription factor [Paenarthrobacter nicotinovorans]|uniref:Response regulator transcription factor n=1 Tax=Paenarthrobacter nicotinovorans TaxID=29320 RepID=A0ABV0GLY2_PAENI
MIRIVVVDDQELIRLGLGLILNAEDDLEVVGEATSGDEAVVMVQTLQPDVILMDVRMPGLDGISATKKIIATRPDSKIIVLTTFDLDDYAFGALRAGASGFLLKDAIPTQLTSAVRAVHEGDAAISPRASKRLLELFADKIPTEAPSTVSQVDALTPRETEILIAIAEGLNNNEIASRFIVSESTVKSHVGRVLMKLDLRDRIQAVLFAYQNGLVP